MYSIYSIELHTRTLSIQLMHRLALSRVGFLAGALLAGGGGVEDFVPDFLEQGEILSILLV